MAEKYTRRKIIAFLSSVAVAGFAGWTYRSYEGYQTQKTRSAIHARINQAGWTGAKPEIFSVEEEAHTYVTGPLALNSGCSVTLVFHKDDASYYGVHGFTTSNPQQTIPIVRGRDGKLYPDALTALKNPTKSQLEQMLTRAGFTKCN